MKKTTRLKIFLLSLSLCGLLLPACTENKASTVPTADAPALAPINKFRVDFYGSIGSREGDKPCKMLDSTRFADLFSYLIPSYDVQRGVHFISDIKLSGQLVDDKETLSWATAKIGNCDRDTPVRIPDGNAINVLGLFGDLGCGHGGTNSDTINMESFGAVIAVVSDINDTIPHL